MALTDKAVRDAKPKATVHRLRDGNVICRGFGVTIAPSGAKTFFLSYTSPEDGKRKQVALGRYPSTSLRDARLKAAEIRAQIDDGQDPAVQKKQDILTRLVKRQLGTLRDLMDLYAADLETDGKRTAKEVRRISGRDIPEHMLSRPAHLITRDDVLDVLTPIAQRGAKVQADNTRSYLRAAFELGLHAQSMTRWRGRAKDFDLTFNPVIGVRKTMSRKPRGQRTLSPTEVRQLWSTDQMTPQMLLALKFILATGQRVEEVLGATWDEFDVPKKLWTIPGSRRKTRNATDEPHLVPLSGLHLEILKEIRDAAGATRFLFPDRAGRGARRHDSLNSSLRRFITETGMSPFSPRDLRRTFKTLAGTLRLPLEIRNRLQGHAMTDVGSVFYDRHDYLAEKREAMDEWAKGLKTILKESD
jgi:integrase